MKNYKFVSLFLIGIVIALNLFGITVDVLASTVYESIDVSVPFTSNGGDTVTLNSDSPEFSDAITLPSPRTASRSDEFVVTFNEPGTYYFSLTNGRKEYSVVISVFSSDSAVLTANTTIYNSNGAKIDYANMYEDIYVRLILDTDGNGSASGGGTFIHGSRVTVIATPAGNSTFVGWRDENGNIVSTDREYTFILDGTYADVYRLTAVFRKTAMPVVATGDAGEIGGLIGAMLVVSGFILIIKKGGVDYEC